MLQLRNGRRYAAAALLGLILALLASTPATAADCEFRLGFKTLRDLIGHDIVGQCLEDEHYNAIGDSNQHTTGGLLAWRKADNWTAFTDGYRTWVNGPDGLQQRLNAERFEWEADYAEITGQAAKPALTRDALRNAEYAANFPSFGTLQRDRIGAQDPLAFGDLNGDGTDDAAVVLLLVDGNAGHRYLAAVLNESGVPRHVASIFLGLNIGIDSVAVANRVVTLQTRQLGPNDPNCCPSQEVVITFRLTDNAWQLLAETPPVALTSAQQRRETVLAVLPHKMAKELGLKEGSAGFGVMVRLLTISIQKALWLYEGHYVMSNPRLGNADPRLAIGNDSEREAFIRQMLNDPDTMRRITREVRAWLYNALSGRATGSIQDTGNVWLNELLRSDPNGFAFWVGSLEEAFVRILTTASMAENVAPLRRSTLERQIGMFLYANEQNPRRTTGPALLPERWIELLLSQ